MLLKCLTCNRLSRYTSDIDLRGKRFYGSWNYCICPFTCGPAGPPICTAEFILKHRRKPMKSFNVTTRVILQEHDEANKTAEIEHLGSFNIEADNFEDAVTKATDLRPDDYFEIIGVVENIA